METLSENLREQDENARFLIPWRLQQAVKIYGKFIREAREK